MIKSLKKKTTTKKKKNSDVIYHKINKAYLNMQQYKLSLRAKSKFYLFLFITSVRFLVKSEKLNIKNFNNNKYKLKNKKLNRKFLILKIKRIKKKYKKKNTKRYLKIKQKALDVKSLKLNKILILKKMYLNNLILTRIKLKNLFYNKCLKLAILIKNKGKIKKQYVKQKRKKKKKIKYLKIKKNKKIKKKRRIFQKIFVFNLKKRKKLKYFKILKKKYNTRNILLKKDILLKKKKLKNLIKNYILSKKKIAIVLKLVLRRKKKKKEKKKKILKRNLNKKVKRKVFLTKRKLKLRRNLKYFKYFLSESRRIVKKVYRIKKHKRKRSLIFLIKYRLIKLVTKNINFIKIKLNVKNIFISFYKRIKGLFLKATCGYYGFTGAKKSTTFAYEHTALNVAKMYYKKTFISMKYKNIRDKIAERRKKRKACIIFYSKNPLFFELQHHLHRRQIRSIIRGFKKSGLGITFLSYKPKSTHNGLWLRKKKRV